MNSKARNVGRVDLGVQVNADPDGVLDWGVHPVSTTFDADLAKANLMRLRRDFRKAEEICIEILRTYPKSAATHTLLGDIYADQGRLEQAAHWYELSLDLDPNSWAEKQKLDDIREQIKERDHVSSAQTLGLDDVGAVRPAWITLGVATFLFLSYGIFYVVKHGRLGGASEQPVVKTPINAVPDNVEPRREMVATNQVATPTPAGTPIDGLTSPGATPSALPLSGSSKDDKELEQAVREKSTYGDNLASLVSDPRIHNVFLTYIVGPKDNERVIGTDLARTLFELNDDFDAVTIRAMRFEKLLFMADIPRDRYNETLTEEWKKKNSSEFAWIEYVITNEWPDKSGKVTPPPPGPEGDNPTPSSAAPTTRKGEPTPSNGGAGGGGNKDEQQSSKQQ